MLQKPFRTSLNKNVHFCLVVLLLKKASNENVFLGSGALGSAGKYKWGHFWQHFQWQRTFTATTLQLAHFNNTISLIATSTVGAIYLANKSCSYLWTFLELCHLCILLTLHLHSFMLVVFHAKHTCLQNNC